MNVVEHKLDNSSSDAFGKALSKFWIGSNVTIWYIVAASSMSDLEIIQKVGTESYSYHSYNIVIKLFQHKVSK